MKQGWQIKRLGEICDILNGFAFKSNEYVKEGVRVIRITNVQKGKIVDEEPKYFPVKRSNEILKYILQDGDLLMSLTGNVGRVGIISSSLLPAALNQRVACLRIKDKTISIKYLFHLLNSNLFEKDCIDSASGIAQLNMSTKWLEQYEMVIPPPSEQQRIVNLLDAECAKIDALKANAEKNLQNAKDLFQAALKKELEPKKGWKNYRLGDICTITSSKRIYKNEYVKEGIPFYRTKEIKEIANGQPISLELYISTERYMEIKKKYGVPQINDILVSAVGTIGEMMIVKDDNPFYFKDGNLVWLRNITKTSAEYLRYYLLSAINRIKEMTIGAAYNALTIEKFQEMQIGLTSDTYVQQSIVARLDTLNEKCKTLQANYEKTLSLCDDLKQALLRKAFNGDI